MDEGHYYITWSQILASQCFGYRALFGIGIHQREGANLRMTYWYIPIGVMFGGRLRFLPLEDGEKPKSYSYINQWSIYF